MVNFKKIVFSLATMATSSSALPLAENGDSNAAATKYIVTLNRGLSDAATAAHMVFAQGTHGESLTRRGLTSAQEEGIRKQFHISEHRSYTGIFDDSTIDAIRGHDSVASVEVVQDMHIQNMTLQMYAPWGLGLLSHDHNNTYSYVYEDQASAEGYYAYVVDTGIRTSHLDFGGRAVFGYNAVTNETGEDLNGHGTHVAGTIGSTTFGVTKKSTLVAVKVCNINGRTDTELVLEGLEWVYSDAKNNSRVGKSVINMSIGGDDSTGYKDAIQVLHSEGFTTVVAAGNSNVNASTSSPANAPEAITVGALDPDYSRSSFSNWGPDVDIFAPGLNVISLGFDADDSTAIMSGTSMASPHVAGLVLYLKDLYSLEKPDDVLAQMQKLAWRDAVRDAKGSTNLLAFNGEKQ